METNILGFAYTLQSRHVVVGSFGKVFMFIAQSTVIQTLSTSEKDHMFEHSASVESREDTCRRLWSAPWKKKKF